MKREAFLGRVRSALHRHAREPAESPPSAPEALLDWDPRELAETFRRELEAVGGRVHPVADLAEARDRLDELLEELDVRTILHSREAEVLGLLTPLPRPVAPAAADADLGVTAARCALAETGTLVLTSAAGRIASLLPMAFVALLRRSQIVPGMAEALAQRPETLPSAWVQLTGPSRTADIELTLTTGVHGPGIVHVLLLED